MDTVAKQRGFTVVMFDIENSPLMDISEDAQFGDVIAAIDDDVFMGVFMSPPCSTFSIARNRYPVRDAEHVRGLPNLSAADARNVAIANACLET